MARDGATRDEMVSERQLIISCARRHLRRLSTSGTARLAADVSLLLCGIRAAVLWDYTAFKPPPGAGSIPSQCFLRALMEVHARARELGLVLVGETLFLVSVPVIVAKISADAAAWESDDPEELGPEFVAVDGHLKAPEFVAARSVRSSLAQLAHALLPQLAAHSKERLEGTGASIARCACPEPATTMVAVHGWLLEYPVIYCYAGGALAQEVAPCGPSSCLGGVALTIVRVLARCATDPQPDGREHLVVSFSLPASDDSTQRLGVARWVSTMQARFDAQKSWRLDAVRVEKCVQQHVVL